MPGVSSTTASRYENWDMMMEYDQCYQHYFYDDDDLHDADEDFFKSSTAQPSEDIWKKFELVPTPPMSPIRTAAQQQHHHHHPTTTSLGDKLEWVSQFLGQDEEQDAPCRVSAAGETTLSNLSSIIIQDCMWSSFSAGQQLEKVVAAAGGGERYNNASACGGGGSVMVAQQQAKVQQTGPSVVPSLGGGGGGRAHGGLIPSDAPLLGGGGGGGSLAADCVDPAAVLTFPLTGGSGGCKKQVSSGSESHTDSSDDEDDDDEDEEEIDVVTVEHKRHNKPRRLVNTRKPVTITVRADPLDPGMKRFHISIHQQQHNYAAPSPDTLPPHVEPSRKRVRQETSIQAPQTLQNSPLHQPRPGHAPLNSESGKSRVAGLGSESPNPNASSPTSSTTPSSPPSSCSSSSSSPSSSSSCSPSSHHHGFPSKSQSFTHLSSPQSSDCEDSDKRKAHNFLERKRRNDLRSRFLSLRDEIPGLAECPKTPKVAILTRATEYLQQLHANERQKAHERRQLKARQLQLLRRLAQLKRS